MTVCSFGKCQAGAPFVFSPLVISIHPFHSHLALAVRLARSRFPSAVTIGDARPSRRYLCAAAPSLSPVCEAHSGLPIQHTNAALLLCRAGRRKTQPQMFSVALNYNNTHTCSQPDIFIQGLMHLFLVLSALNKIPPGF